LPGAVIRCDSDRTLAINRGLNYEWNRAITINGIRYNYEWNRAIAMNRIKLEL